MNSSILHAYGNESADLTESNSHGRSLVEIVLWSILLAILMLVSSVGNILVIVCVRTSHKLQEDRGNIFLVNLSVADLLTAVIVMSGSLISLVEDKWVLGGAWCNIVCAANYTLIIVSMLTLCFISLDRYIAVVHALHYHSKVTNARIYMLITYAWCQGVCFGVPPILARWIEYDYWEVICAIEWQKNNLKTLNYVIVAFILCFLSPGVIMAVAYTKVMKVAKSHNSVHPIGAYDNVNKAVQCAANQNSKSQVTRNMVEMSDYSSSTSHEFRISRRLTQTPFADKDKDSNSKRLLRYILQSNSKSMSKDWAKQNLDQKQSEQSTNANNIYSKTLTFSLAAAGDKLVDHSCSDIALCDSKKTAESTQPVGNVKLPSFNEHGAACDQHKFLSIDSTTYSDELQLVSRLNSLVDNRTLGDEHLIADITQKRRRKKNYGVSSKAVRSLLIVVLAFFICMAPFSCTKLYKVIVPRKDALPGYVNLVASIFQFCSSAVNPLIYGIFRKDFRAAFLSLLKKLFAKV
ncbi:octopamine receptor 1 [Biomphalaria pfeifferi]|uniref:Octopamine receptor 1 n=1 Tax=Biomphalaria pfeifferi TaxID=112525 RepID=A0AAD8EXM5_BIOPF|nr:octopamine receptor 1 [Biomphalaria pfeifferi]